MNDYISRAKAVMREEAQGILSAADHVDHNFSRIVREILNSKGRVILTGVGKSGIIAQKFAATLSSTGTPSFYMHPAEASHGDLGMVKNEDMILMLSNSGESAELLHIVPSLKRIQCRIFLMTAKIHSHLAAISDICLVLPNLKEADPLGLAPTVSSTAMLALGDALAIVLLQERNFSKENFALYHPAGSLGKKLTTRVKDLMIVRDNIPMVTKDYRLNEAIFEISSKGLGATVVVDTLENKRIAGIITDGDIRRIVDKNKDIWYLPVDQVMTTSPVCAYEDTMAVEALKKMETHKITSLPVVNGDSKLIGMIHLHHILLSGIM